MPCIRLIHSLFYYSNPTACFKGKRKEAAVKNRLFSQQFTQILLVVIHIFVFKIILIVQIIRRKVLVKHENQNSDSGSAEKYD